MIDLHCHILPDIDDGPAIIEQSMDMCRMAVADGIETIVSTPHFKPGLFELPVEGDVMSAAERLNKRIREAGLKLEVLIGAEVRVTEDIEAYLDEFRFITINGNGKYVLVEFPRGEVPRGWDDTLVSLLDKGITPVIAHPERNRWFYEDPDRLAPVVGKGVLLQITAESLTGGKGEDISRLSAYLLERALVHVIATDSHSTTRRPPVLSRAVEEAALIVGESAARAMVTTTPSAIISGIKIR